MHSSKNLSFFQKETTAMVVKIYKTAFVQISNVSILYLVEVMETATVMEPHVYVKQALAELTVPLI